MDLKISEIEDYILAKYHRNPFIINKKESKRKEIQLYEDYPFDLFEFNVIEYSDIKGNNVIRFLFDSPFPFIQICCLSKENRIVIHTIPWYKICSPFFKNYDVIDVMILYAQEYEFNSD